jgi:diacylglycerol kinase family enzyme
MIVVAGGDGTISLLLEDLRRKKVNINSLVFIALPFGTGNDLAQQTGWGAQPYDSDVAPWLSNLKLTLQ